MRRFLLLALGMGFLLPTAVNAEEIYLSCTGSRSDSYYNKPKYPYFEIAINTVSNSVIVFGTEGHNAFLSQSQGNFLITNYEKATGWKQEIFIDRKNGRYKLNMYNERRSDKSYKYGGKGKCIKKPITERLF